MRRHNGSDWKMSGGVRAKRSSYESSARRPSAHVLSSCVSKVRFNARVWKEMNTIFCALFFFA